MPPEPEVVVHVVDDDSALRSALRRLLQHAGYAVRECAAAGDFILTPTDPRPGCLLLDLQLAGPSGLELQQALVRRGSKLPIIFMSAYGDVPRTVQAMLGGARDFLVKPMAGPTLLAAIEAALAAAAAEASQPAMLPPLPPLAEKSAYGLTERELLVLRGVVAGQRNRDIAAQLRLGERTIKSSRAGVMRKLGAHSVAELVRIARPLLGD
jgi:FixJ family two-component response regulator